VKIDFVSDNASGLCPEALDAFVAAHGGRAAPYGADEETSRAVRAFTEVFDAEVEVFFVATGTAANTLAIASLTRPWQRILCEEFAHLATDESTAPERLTGCRVTTVPAQGRKLSPAHLEQREAALSDRGVHSVAPGVVSISNPPSSARSTRRQRWRHSPRRRMRWATACTSTGPGSPTPSRRSAARRGS
jgi:threonine aldolase